MLKAHRILFSISILFLLGTNQPVFGHSDLIQQLSGCFAVSYRYVENSQHEDSTEGVYEWVTFERRNNVFLLQHYGVFEDQAARHWREEWSQQENETWLQRVIGPAENFRYECANQFEFNQWRCTVENAPKPRRDRRRADYSTLDRENTLQITQNGWIHAQNNRKRTESGEIVSNELGWNEYRRVDSQFCQAAIDLAETD